MKHFKKITHFEVYFIEDIQKFPDKGMILKYKSKDCSPLSYSNAEHEYEQLNIIGKQGKEFIELGFDENSTFYNIVASSFRKKEEGLNNNVKH